MSHVRDLFHKSYGTGPSPVPLTPPPELTGRPPIQQFGPNGAAVELPEPPFELASCLVEHAQVRPEHRLVFYTEPHGAAADRFLYLTMRLLELWRAGKLKRLLITSPLSDEGKSTVTLNLATAFAERGRRAVLLI